MVRSEGWDVTRDCGGRYLGLTGCCFSSPSSTGAGGVADWRGWEEESGEGEGEEEGALAWGGGVGARTVATNSCTRFDFGGSVGLIRALQPHKTHTNTHTNTHKPKTCVHCPLRLHSDSTESDSAASTAPGSQLGNQLLGHATTSSAKLDRERKKPNLEIGSCRQLPTPI